MTDIAGFAPHRRDQHPVVGIERRGATHIDDERRGRGAEPIVKRLCGNGKTALVHGALLAGRVAQSLDDRPSDGVSA